MRTSMGKLRPFWALAALAAGLLLGAWHPSGQFAATASLEGRLLDLRHMVRGPVPPPPDFVVVAVDDKTLSRLQRFPVPRSSIADAINRLTDAGAKVVAVDLLLLEREAPATDSGLSAGDAALAEALRRNGHVILAAAATPDLAATSGNWDTLIRRNSFPIVEKTAGFPEFTTRPVGAMLPIDALAEVAQLAQVNVPRDPDNALRRIPLAMPVQDTGYLPAMPLEVVRLLRDVARGDMRLRLGDGVMLGGMWIPTDVDSTIALNHYGGQGSFPTYSLIDVIDGQVPPQALAGKAVFVGSTALGIVDMFLSPYSAQLPGVEALATAAANIATGTYLRHDGTTFVIDLILAGALGLLAFFAANFRSLGAAALGTAALWLAAATALQLAFSQMHLWLDGTGCVLALAGVGLVTFGGRIVQQRRISGELQHERDNLARYHSPLLTDWLAAQRRPSFNERAQDAAVMFVDVAGFTRRSERVGPAATVDFLRDLHGRIERAALAHRGVIEQFMGDGAMIIFGLPEPGADDAARALAAAQQLMSDLGDWNIDLKGQGEEPVRLRVGLHYGPVVAALLGGERQGQITVAGDTVNVASRLQEMGKEHGAAIVASAEFVTSVRSAGRDDLLAGLQRLTGQKVRGRDETIDLWIHR
ncbi:MAG TPA: adenylate/guanylate cyclase domain-containing protein [Alphaproteobacteria bacterium]|nr:adenylate/guanylate cyclase domain-containing protein [Alphaproteobacteria bacterium]